MRLLAVLALSLIACGREDDVPDRAFDACAPLALAADDGDPAHAQAIADATALWRARGVGNFADGGEVLPVIFEEAAPALHGMYDPELAVIYLNLALDADPDARAITLAHELGHAFGLAHVDRLSVMEPGNLSVAPTDGDAADVRAIWGDCR